MPDDYARYLGDGQPTRCPKCGARLTVFHRKLPKTVLVSVLCLYCSEDKPRKKGVRYQWEVEDLTGDGLSSWEKKE